MLSLSVCNRIESSDANNLSNCVAAAIVRIRVCPKNTAEVGLQPEILRSFSFLASLVDAVALYGSGNRYMHAHVKS
jgi:hypothetical protein